MEEVKASFDPQAVVMSSGLVMVIPHLQLESTCMLDLLHFPYDTQQCGLQFGSWVYDEGKVGMLHLCHTSCKLSLLDFRYDTHPNMF